MPSATAFPKKISENDSPTTALMPLRRIAWGACSRDEPHPKFRLTRRIAAPAYRSSLSGWVDPCARLWAMSSSNR
jgi:hypothetical protein